MPNQLRLGCDLLPLTDAPQPFGIRIIQLTQDEQNFAHDHLRLLLGTDVEGRVARL
jgi:hypothetical protein